MLPLDGGSWVARLGFLGCWGLGIAKLWGRGRGFGGLRCRFVRIFWDTRAVGFRRSGFPGVQTQP